MKKALRVLLPLLCAAVCFSLCGGSFGVCAQEKDDREEIYSIICELSPYEVSLLERAVEATAPDGSFALRVSLAATLLNRLDSPLFPDSLPKLIRGSSFLSGKYSEPSKKTRQAVLSALLGCSPVCRSVYARRLGDGEEIPKEAVSYVMIDGWVFWEN